MQIYDLIMIAVLAAAIAFGAWKGLAWQVASLSAIFVSYFVAYEFRQPVAERINASPPWNIFVAMLILYLLTSLLIWLTFRLVKSFIDKVKLKDFDRHAGALLGAAKGVVLCVIVTLFSMTLLSDSQKDAISRSRSGYYIAMLLDRAHPVMPAEVHDVLHPYLHKLDQQMPHPHSSHNHAHLDLHDSHADSGSASLPELDVERSAKVLQGVAEGLLKSTR
jgi:membrane protein required for colicin V production